MGRIKKPKNDKGLQIKAPAVQTLNYDRFKPCFSLEYQL